MRIQYILKILLVAQIKEYSQTTHDLSLQMLTIL